MRRQLSLAEIIRQPSPGLDHPGSVAFAPADDAVTYLQADERAGESALVRSLWWHDLADGTRQELIAPAGTPREDADLAREEQLRRERMRTIQLGVTEYAWSTAVGSSTLLVPRSGAALVALAGRPPAPTPVSGVTGTSCTILSPDGRRLAFVRDGDAWIAELPDGPLRQLTDDAENGVFNGLAEYAAAEELERYEGLWWSADGEAIACVRVDERTIPSFAIAHLSDDAPGAETHRYPFAGGPNAEVTLRVLRADGSATVTVALPMAADDYLARVVARPPGGWLVGILPRHQRALRWCWVGQDGSVRDGWEEHAEPWINLDADTRAMADGRVVRSTEATGYRHLELRAADGTLERRLTEGDWVVTGVCHVDEAGGHIFFVGTRHGATERHLYRVAIDAPRPVREPERLTDEPGWHEVVFSRSGRRWLDTWSRLDRPPRVTVRDRDGAEVAVLHEPSTSAEGLGIVVPELTTVTAADGETRLHAALYRAATTEGNTPPAILTVYGGPHIQLVADKWEVTALMARQALARAGATVVVVDNRGSANRGLAFEASIRHALGGAEVADQVAAIRELAQRGELDERRVGVTGGSYGGFMTLRCLAAAPDLFRVGVAVAPVTSWDGYDTAYTERYLENPQGAPDAYRESSALALAGAIHGDLLLIHGELDENVHLRHSVRLLAALRAAERDAELVILPGQRHRVRGEVALRTRELRLLAHLLRGIGLEFEPG